MKIRLLFFFLILTLAVPLKAQKIISAGEASNYFNKINQAYAACKSLSMEVNHKFYSSYSDSSALEAFDGYYYKKANKEYSCIAGIISIQDSRHRLTVDTANKTMLLSNPVQIQNDPSSITTLLGVCKKITFSETPLEYVFQLQFGPKNPEFSSIKIRVERSSNFILGITIYHSDVDEIEKKGNKIKAQAKTEITYLNIRKNTSISDKKFSLKDYLTQNEGRWALNHEYSNYIFYNNLIR